MSFARTALLVVAIVAFAWLMFGVLLPALGNSFQAQGWRP